MHVVKDVRVAAGLLAAASLSGCGASPPEPPLRLIERGEQVRAEWPELGGARPPGDPAPARIGRLAPPGEVVEVRMHRGADNRDSRAALLAPAGSAYVFHGRLPAEPSLRLALGHVLRDGDAAERSLSYRVTVTPAAGEPVTVLDETRPAGAAADWLDREVTLDEWAGREVELRLEVSEAGEAPAAAAGPLWAAWATPEIVDRRWRDPGWNVLLISLDTLRADHLGCYGYRRPTSPAIDALAASGVRFAVAVSQSPWTRPSHWSMFTGLYPISHGELSSPPLAVPLWQAGYRTAAVTGGGQVDGSLGFHAGFESYRTEYWIHDVGEVLRFFEDSRDRSSFLFLHTYEIHDPYTHTRFADGLPSGRIEGPFSRALWESWQRQISDEEKAYAEALYDGGIAYVDEQLGILLRELDERGVLENTLVILTSDHGEQFWEHGSWRHGSTLYDHQLLVPLILKLPAELERRLGGAATGRVIGQQVELIDLYPTVLDLLGIERPWSVQGASLRPLLDGRELPARQAFSENTNIQAFERKSLRHQRFKFIHSIPRKKTSQAEEYFQLFDLARDPHETQNLADDNPELVARLRDQMSRLVSGDGTEGLQEEVPADVSPELAAQLEALGYLAGGRE